MMFSQEELLRYVNVNNVNYDYTVVKIKFNEKLKISLNSNKNRCIKKKFYTRYSIGINFDVSKILNTFSWSNNIKKITTYNNMNIPIGSFAITISRTNKDNVKILFKIKRIKKNIYIDAYINENSELATNFISDLLCISSY